MVNFIDMVVNLDVAAQATDTYRIASGCSRGAVYLIGCTCCGSIRQVAASNSGREQAYELECGVCGASLFGTPARWLPQGVDGHLRPAVSGTFMEEGGGGVFLAGVEDKVEARLEWDRRHPHGVATQCVACLREDCGRCGDPAPYSAAELAV